MKIYKILIIVFLPFSFILSHAQENKDSLLSIYNRVDAVDSVKFQASRELYKMTFLTNLAESEEYARELLRLANKTNNYEHLAIANEYLAGFYHQSQQNDSAKFYYREVLDLRKQKNDILAIARAEDNIALLEYKKGNYKYADSILSQSIEAYKSLNDSVDVAYNYDMLSRVYEHQGFYRRALQSSLNSYQIYNALQNESGKTDALVQLAIVENSLGNFEQGIKYNLEALEILEKNNNNYFSAVANINLSENYLDLHKLENAEHFAQIGLKLSTEMQAPEMQADALNILARINLHKENLNQALEYAKKALQIYEKIEISSGILESMNMLGNIHNELDDENSALSYLNKAIELGENKKANSFLAEAYYHRALAHEKSGNLTEAFDDYKNFHELKENFLNDTKSKQIEEMRAIFDTEKKEQQIAQQETEITLLEEKEKVSRLQKIALGGGLGLSLLTLGFGLYGIRQRTKRNRLEKEKINAELQLKEAELAFKKKELTTHAMHLAKKNEVLENVKQKAKELKTSENGGRAYQQLIQTINFDQQDDKNWENFTQYFEQVHKDFSKIVKTKYPDITKNELRLMALLKMNLSSKEIATILNISSDGIKKARQRLRKKMELSSGESLEATVLTL